MSTQGRIQQKSDAVYELGLTDQGDHLHLIDFDTDSALARALDGSDKMLCGQVGDYERVDASALKHFSICTNCLKRVDRVTIRGVGATEVISDP